MIKKYNLRNKLSSILIIIFLSLNLSCSKEKKKVKKFELNKNIDFKEESFTKKNNIPIKDKKIYYDFKNKKDKIIYSVDSLQLLTSTYSQILITINFDINFKRILDEDKKTKKEKIKKKENNIEENKFKYKVYFTNFKLKHKVFYGFIDFSSIKKKYSLLINSIYFNMKIDKYGKKTFNIENKVALNSKFKAMSGFIFNLLNNIFIELPKNLESNKSFSFFNKKFELSSEYEENGSLKLKLNADSRRLIEQEEKSDYTILKSDDLKSKLRVLFSLKDKFPEKINLLFEDKDKLEYKDQEYEYSIKNYFFIKKLNKLNKGD